YVLQALAGLFDVGVQTGKVDGDQIEPPFPLRQACERHPTMCIGPRAGPARSLTEGVGSPPRRRRPSPLWSIRLGVRPRSGPTVTSFGRSEGVPTSRRSAVTGSLAAVRETGLGPTAGAAAAAGAAAGASAGTVSNDIPSTR